MSTQSMRGRSRGEAAREKPSKATKDRVAQLLHQEVTECGKIATHLCKHSGSREVLMKSAKKMASQEVAMENTLSNLRQIERIVDKAMNQANSIERSMEQASAVQDQLRSLTLV